MPGGSEGMSQPQGGGEVNGKRGEVADLVDRKREAEGGR